MFSGPPRAAKKTQPSWSRFLETNFNDFTTQPTQESQTFDDDPFNQISAPASWVEEPARPKPIGAGAFDDNIITETHTESYSQAVVHEERSLWDSVTLKEVKQETPRSSISEVFNTGPEATGDAADFFSELGRKSNERWQSEYQASEDPDKTLKPESTFNPPATVRRGKGVIPSSMFD